ncbi:MAG: hypothetical protein JSS03_00805 [Proteobacteria bacterium]|nr:hypothetical protein [Pseudomonadota bacterium]
MRHVRQARLCARGARAWFAAHGLDWSAFVRHGLPIERVEAIDDAFAQAVAVAARAAAVGGPSSARSDPCGRAVPGPTGGRP